MRLRCSFCGRDQHAVGTLFKGLTSKNDLTSVYICDDCVHQCGERLKHEPTLLAKAESVADYVNESTRIVRYNDRFWELSPRLAERVWETAFL